MLSNGKPKIEKSRTGLTKMGSVRSHTGLSFLSFVGGLALFCILVGLVILGRPLFIPLLLATVLWYLINLLTDGYGRFPMAFGRIPMAFGRLPMTFGHMPRILAVTLAFATVMFFGWIIYSLVVSNATAAFALLSGSSALGNSDIPTQLSSSLREFIDLLPEWLPISLPSDRDLSASINDIFSNIDQAFNAVWGTTRQAFSQVSATATTIAFVLLYLIFMFLEQGTFNQKIRALTATPGNLKIWHGIVTEVTYKLNAYVIIKSSMSLITALLSLAVYWTFNIQFALFWALMVLIFNFIPVFGSIIGWVLPMIVVVLGDYALAEVFIIAVLLIAPHQLVGSFIEPRIAGDALNISPLVILLSLAFWNMVLGILGLFVAVPLTVLIMTILAQFKGTRWIAILLSRNGNISQRKHSKNKE